MIKRAITRSQLLNAGYDKSEIRDMVKSGQLKESWGRMAMTGQLVRCYEGKVRKKCQ